MRARLTKQMTCIAALPLLSGRPACGVSSLSFIDTASACQSRARKRQSYLFLRSAKGRATAWENTITCNTVVMVVVFLLRVQREMREIDECWPTAGLILSGLPDGSRSRLGTWRQTLGAASLRRWFRVSN